MDDIWLCVEEDSNSSHISAYSDNVDSEIESELYSMIHHQDNLSSINKLSEENSKHVSTSDISNSLHLNDRLYEGPEKNKTSFICSFKNSPASLNLKPEEILFNIDKSSSAQNLHNLNMFLKPSLCDSQQDSQSTNLSLSNSTQFLNNKVCKNSSKKSNFLKPNKIIIESSSDSDDSILWIEPDSSFKNDMKINLFNNDISISSKSLDDSLIIPSTLQPKESNFKNSSQPKRKWGENSKDLWHINDEDLYRSKKKSRRYHDSIDSPQCSNCGKKNHFAKSCRVSKAIKCFYCGDSHVASNCNKRICSKCYGTGHDNKYCWMNVITYCLHCNMKGHVKRDCPDIWRRYHLTTNPVKIIPGVPINHDRRIYCFNCGWPGHFGAECKEPRIKNSYPTWPCVISYSNPDELLVKKFKSQRSENNNIGENIYGNKRQQDFIARRGNSNKNRNINATQNFADSRNIQNQQGNMNQNFVAKRKNTKKTKNWEFFKQRQININRQRKAELREKNFPRTPKKPIISQDFTDTVPEFISLELKQSLKKKKKNQKRRWKRYIQKLTSENS